MSNFTYELPLEDDFFRTLKDYVIHNKHSAITELLKQSTMQFAPTSTFTEIIWDTYWCSIIFSIPVTELANVKKADIELLKKYCSNILPPNSGFLIKEITFVPQIVTAKVEEPSLEVVFEEQKAKIISEIKQAKYMIWIAVAWFTLDEIYDLLVEKRKEGLEIRIIVSQDAINKAAYGKYKDKLQIFGYPKFGMYNDNFMHNKFCVIDLKKVIHGSYNWSKKAAYNKETVEVIDDRKTAENFSDEFMKLYLEVRK